MKDINVINFFEENNLNFSSNFNLGVTNLPSKLNFGEEINNIKNNQLHANMKFTFSNPEYSGLGDKFDWAKSAILITYNYKNKTQPSMLTSPGYGLIARFAEKDYYLPLKNKINEIEQVFEKLNIKFKSFIDNPNVAVLTPGIHNSAYYEHSFLADEMGVDLLQGSDLEVRDGRVIIRTTEGTAPVDVIYRRIDDEFLDPLSFNPDSLLGTPGLFDAYRSGAVMLANAPGAGIADDKAIYSYMPEIIEFYMGEKPLLDNIPTWRCSEPDNLAYVLAHLPELVVKEVHGSGGYGMLVGPAASKRELATFTRKLKANPANYVAQPTLSLSTVPILTRSGLAPRHVDLRPFVLVSPKGIRVTPGGLTRVALRKGSLVVNSSQGGGTKDTWVLES